MINGHSLDDFTLDEDLQSVKLYCQKQLIRTFIAQCLHNSLSLNSKHGHRGNDEIKRIIITISESSITIEDTCKKENYTIDEKIRRAERFKTKLNHIKKMNCDEYSSTTLTSLQGFVNYMRKNDVMKTTGIEYNCDFGFNKDYNFFVNISFFNRK